MHIAFGMGDYVQERGALERLAERARGEGCARAFIVTEEPGWAATEGRLDAALLTAGIAYDAYAHDESYPSYGVAEALAGDARARVADVVIGVGGGRAIDLAKLLADKLRKQLLLAPTNAAQCACFTPLTVVYRPNGARDGDAFITVPILGTYVDTRVMLCAPPRLLAAGAADALAKLAETYSAVMYGGPATARWEAAVAMSQRSAYILLKRTGAALGGDEAALEDAVYAAVCLTGLLSAMASDRPSPMLAHNLYAAACDLYPGVPRRALHGEIVGVGVLLTAYACDIPGLPAAAAYRFLKDTLHAPTTWAQLGYCASEAEFERVFDFITGRKQPLPEAQRERVREALRRVWK